MSFVLYTMNVEYMCDANYVTWKKQTIQKISCNFLEKK